MLNLHLHDNTVIFTTNRGHGPPTLMCAQSMCGAHAAVQPFFVSTEWDFRVMFGPPDAMENSERLELRQVSTVDGS